MQDFIERGDSILEGILGEADEDIWMRLGAGSLSLLRQESWLKLENEHIMRNACEDKGIRMQCDILEPSAVVEDVTANM